MRFSIPQTIVKCGTDIRQPEKTGGLRKIEIAGTGLRLQCSKDVRWKTVAVFEYASMFRGFHIPINGLG
ncbi:TPA: hypothetical protein QDE31_20895 [Burkholderia cenocepacia]|nr:hypothetical protein [Burkholderia cenocepacia]HDR9876899.1 hypothetical protein [Burkholderia cenocepacia]HDR9883968.1 hypothetical protein [Burkholderia cenocepacia]